jgi:tRNA dimethylallyltransferase
VGYKELFAYFDGSLDKERAIELIKQHTRHYAKRQMTWFKRDSEINWFHPDDISAMRILLEKSLNTAE